MHMAKAFSNHRHASDFAGVGDGGVGASKTAVLLRGLNIGSTLILGTTLGWVTDTEKQTAVGKTENCPAADGSYLVFATQFQTRNRPFAEERGKDFFKLRLNDAK